MKEDMHCQLDYGEWEVADPCVAERNEVYDTAGKSDNKYTLFWNFPRGKGKIQPWRRKLWELQNQSDRE
ncbi:hypothetical protein HQN87_27105 [Paenibacillus tritici]|uniref:Uncharacterized protein n=1 Tax=Paenibacillus tritici TaxID=1873425 RepID=A0ABX2DWN9_9BACL|nr:hypothetical protein [Paenibacillus tritici]NQX48997.1 hypothetical protein [Paenibacillus tritici]